MNETEICIQPITGGCGFSKKQKNLVLSEIQL